jgi:hypothetical protein
MIPLSVKSPRFFAQPRTDEIYLRYSAQGTTLFAGTGQRDKLLARREYEDYPNEIAPQKILEARDRRGAFLAASRAKILAALGERGAHAFRTFELCGAISASDRIARQKRPRAIPLAGIP